MGNLCAGYHLIKRLTLKDVYGLTLPILTTRGGEKFGKSAGNAIWLDANKTSEFSLYQYFLRVEDDDVERLLKMLTLIPAEEIEDILVESRKATHLRKAQQCLAEHLTILIHGSAYQLFSYFHSIRIPILLQINRIITEKGLQKAKGITAALYEGDFTALANLTGEEMHSLFTGATHCQLAYEPGMSTLDIALKAKCFKHERE